MNSSTQTMPYREAIMLAYESIWAHKLRSFLTLLGVILGVMAVVAVASFIEMANKSVLNTVTNDFGANTITLDKYGLITSFDDFIDAQKRNKDITQDDFRALKEGVTLAEDIGIVISQSVETLRVGSQELYSVAINGETPDMANIMVNGTTVDEGRFITDIDNDQRRNVVFIGSKLKETFFPTVNPIGKELRILGEPFEIIGVAKAIGSTFGQERDSYAVIPFQTHLKMFGARQSLTIYFKAPSPEKQEPLQDQIRVIMRARHHLMFSEKDNFGFISADALNELWQSLSSLIAAVALAVTSISLVVGGIVIMNIMMVSVTERTREIGIRKSLGARQKDILLQFLVESSMLSGFGGLVGVILIGAILLIVAQAFSLSVSMPLWAVFLSLFVSLSVGIIFGLYPAYRAARLDPIVALRQE
ncbi:MAG: ABC transporter permease [Acidobacteria bacterium]|nr:ABC transporter permease [Acidobacteriota bacterium]